MRPERLTSLQNYATLVTGRQGVGHKRTGHSVYIVTLPNGKRYNYSNRNASRARVLATKTGGKLAFSATTEPYGANRAAWSDDRAVCECRRAACGGCDDAFDAMRDADVIRHGIGRRY